jgi:hypothetical protein
MCESHLAPPVDLSVRGSGFRHEGLGVQAPLPFRVQGLGFGVRDLLCIVKEGSLKYRCDQRFRE